MKTWVRVLSVILCLSFVCCFIARPVYVSASAQEEILVAFGSVAAYLGCSTAIIFAIIVAMGIAEKYDFSFEDVLAMAESWYADAEAAALRAWLEVLVVDGVRTNAVVELSPEVQAYLRWQANYHGVTLPATIEWIILPADFARLDTLTLSDVFGVDVSTTLYASNTISLSIKAAITDLKSSVVSIPRIMEQSFAELKEWSMSAHDTTSQFLRNVYEMTQATNSNVVKFGRDTVEWLKTVNSNLAYHTGKIISAVDSLGVQITTIPVSIESLGVQITSIPALTAEEIAKALEGLGGAVVIPNYAVAVDKAVAVEDALRRNTDEGKKNFHLAVQSGNDLLRKYGNAFLALAAILNMFLALPVVGELAQFGLAIGIFALLVNLANTISYSSGNSAKSKKSGKGG